MDMAWVGGNDVVERFYEPLYRFGLSLSRSEDGAADLTQETFLLWATKGHQIRDLSKAKSWLFTTLYREFLKRKRQIGLRVVESIDDHEEISTVVEETGWLSAAHALEPSDVMDALSDIEETQRIPLTMFYVEEFTYKEIADALELPIGTVMSRLSRGKEKLRQLLVARIQSRGSAFAQDELDANASTANRIIPLSRNEAIN